MSRRARGALGAALALSALALLARAVAGAQGGREERRVGDLGQVGQVALPTTCDPLVQARFERALALLHSFFYAEARREFEGVVARDPRCAMGHWGVAMTYWHPLWAPPDERELEAGRAAAERAAARGGGNERERGFIRAVVAYYAVPGPAAAERPGGAHAHAGSGPGGVHRARALAFEQAMKRLHERFPEDVEVGTFHALAILATAPPGDPSLAHQRRAGGILERLFARHREHPGVAHYLIHAYDHPALARRALPAARIYAQIAPWVPHALHMPSHVFVRLGMWQETVASNLDSAAAAQAHAAERHRGATSFEELHALDYLAYGYLQLARDDMAQRVVDRVAGVTATEPESDFVAAYAMGAVPARFALERQRWQEAAALTPREHPLLEQFPFAEAHVVFARGVGAARTGDAAEAERAAARLAELERATDDARFEYFARQTGLQRRAVLALAAYARGEVLPALDELRAAAGEEDALGKHPTSPGAVYPIRELLAETLLEEERAVEALGEYGTVLRLNPRRFTALFGAGRAAEAAGRPDEARRHYAELVGMATPTGPVRRALAHARAYLVGARR